MFLTWKFVALIFVGLCSFLHERSAGVGQRRDSECENWAWRCATGFSMADIKGESDVKLSIVSLKPGGHGAQGREDSREPSISHLPN